MRNRFISSLQAAGMALLLISVTSAPTNGQAKSGQPRTPDGHPDFQGTYDLATMTPFERLPGDPPVLTKEQAQKLQKAEADRRAGNGRKLDPKRPPPPPGGG